VEHLFEPRSLLDIEGSMNSMRTRRTPPKRLLETFIVEPMDDVAHGLVVAAQKAGDLVSVLSFGAFEQDLRAAQGEGLEGERRPAFKVSRSASLKGRT
jgi:hypothetical protein